MIGLQSNIGNLVSDEVAEAVDLYCYEQLPPEEAEFFVLTRHCCICQDTLLVEVPAHIWAVERYKNILQNHRFLCPPCSRRRRL